VNINLHAGDQFRHLSLTRTTYLLNNGSTLVSEVSDTNPELRELIFEASYEKVEEEDRRFQGRDGGAEDQQERCGEPVQAVVPVEVLVRGLHGSDGPGQLGARRCAGPPRGTVA
jgi:hypothetical protein